MLGKVNRIHTLGPTGTNCEAAANEWFRRQGRKGEVLLHATLEEAAAIMGRNANEALLGCVVYPELHTLVFSNLDRFELVDCFVMPTFPMLLASTGVVQPTKISCHPAPRGLVPAEMEIRLVNSNSQAAIDCVDGLSDGCITTSSACQKYGLTVLRDFGPVPMGFTIHTPISSGDTK